MTWWEKSKPQGFGEGPSRAESPAPGLTLRCGPASWKWEGSGGGAFPNHGRGECEQDITLEVSRIQKGRTGGGPVRVAKVTLCVHLTLTHELFSASPGTT